VRVTLSGSVKLDVRSIYSYIERFKPAIRKKDALQITARTKSVRKLAIALSSIVGLGTLGLIPAAHANAASQAIGTGNCNGTFTWYYYAGYSTAKVSANDADCYNAGAGFGGIQVTDGTNPFAPTAVQGFAASSYHGMLCKTDGCGYLIK
jgi:hypothetical protein